MKHQTCGWKLLENHINIENLVVNWFKKLVVYQEGNWNLLQRNCKNQPRPTSLPSTDGVLKLFGKGDSRGKF